MHNFLVQINRIAVVPIKIKVHKLDRITYSWNQGRNVPQPYRCSASTWKKTHTYCSCSAVLFLFSGMHYFEAWLKVLHFALLLKTFWSRFRKSNAVIIGKKRFALDSCNSWLWMKNGSVCPLELYWSSSDSTAAAYNKMRNPVSTLADRLPPRSPPP